MNQIILIYLLLINLTGFFIMLLDKNRAIQKKWRVSEKTLIEISSIGGSLGMLLGMHLFRHKTKHLKFTLGIPVILLLQIVIALYFLTK